MIYNEILKAFLTYENYAKYSKALDYPFIKDNYPELYRLFRTLDIQYNEAPTSLTPVELEAAFYKAYPGTDKKLYSGIFDLLQKEPELSKEKIDETCQAIKRHSDASKLGVLALEVAAGRREYSELQSVLHTFSDNAIGGSDALGEHDFVTDDLDSLIENAYAEGGGLNWRLPSLNRSLGPIRKGDLGTIFARPETGKTSFLASEVSFMAEQLAEGETILWFNNEEQGSKVKLRLYEASLGAPLDSILSNRAKAQARFLEKTGGRIRLLDDGTGLTRKRCEDLCRLHKPRLVVFDQLDKVKGFADDRDDLLLGKIYQWARELAKEYAPVIGVCQASGDAEGIKYLNMGHMANAKTAKQAECDWILGIGIDFNDPPFVRGLAISKNKLLGSKDTVQDMRHGRWEVILDAEIGRYRDIADEAQGRK